MIIIITFLDVLLLPLLIHCVFPLNLFRSLDVPKNSNFQQFSCGIFLLVPLYEIIN
jgi:hypothetical protein